MPFWYLEFEAYKVDGSFYVKEIAILKNDRTECWNYYISHHDISVPTSYEFRRQASQLQLAWSFGDYRFDDAIVQIKTKIGNDIVIFCTRNSEYDTEKYTFLKNFLPQLIEQFYEVGFEMVNCINDKCDVNHGFCARQRMHELRYYDYNKHNSDLFSTHSQWFGT